MSSMTIQSLVNVVDECVSPGGTGTVVQMAPPVPHEEREGVTKQQAVTVRTIDVEEEEEEEEEVGEAMVGVVGVAMEVVVVVVGLVMLLVVVVVLLAVAVQRTNDRVAIAGRGWKDGIVGGPSK